jgi:hypothetical protein
MVLYGEFGSSPDLFPDRSRSNSDIGGGLYRENEAATEPNIVDTTSTRPTS